MAIIVVRYLQGEAFARVIEHCTVHNSLVRPPTVTMDLVRSDLAA